jgi:hypothetical protein
VTLLTRLDRVTVSWGAKPSRNSREAGDTHHAVGDHNAARDAWEQAQAIYEDLQHPDAEQVRLKLKSLT